MADRPLSIDTRKPLLLKANDLVLLTQEDGNFPLDVPGFGLFYRDTCYLGAYALRLHGTEPLLLMAFDERSLGTEPERAYAFKLPRMCMPPRRTHETGGMFNHARQTAAANGPHAFCGQNRSEA